MKAAAAEAEVQEEEEEGGERGKTESAGEPAVENLRSALLNKAPLNIILSSRISTTLRVKS